MNSLLSVSGKALRMRRLVDRISGRCLMIPLDHSLADGPVASPLELRGIVRDVAGHGGDAIVVHKGRARFLPPEDLADLALVVHLNGCTRYAQDANAKELLASAEDAVAIGADAVSIHINLGSATETRQLRDLASVAGECARLGLPLLAMVYPRGPGIGEQPQAELINHAANLAADMGADIVKLPYCGDVATMARLVDESPLPILVAGGAQQDEEAFLAFAADMLACGALGIAAGRNVFNSPHVPRLMARLSSVVHGDRSRVARLAQ